jgi:ribosomal protein L4
VNQKRYAVVSAIAASGVPALVMSKGHLIGETPEFPLVVQDKIQEYEKTKQAIIFLRRMKLWKDVEKVRRLSLPHFSTLPFMMNLQYSIFIALGYDFQ